MKGSSDSFHDLFDSGFDRFVLGKLPSAGNATKRKLTPQEIFMKAIMDDEEEAAKAAEEA